MFQGWRWFGPEDAISLREIRQAGVTDIVTALHHIGCGELWTVEEITKRVREVSAAGMRWSVVESVPIHESIKTRSGDFRRYIDIYKENIRNLAQCGVKIICYNFMPILDWTRTNLQAELEDGSTVLKCDEVEIAAFDLFILKRPNAEKEYEKDIILQAKNWFEKSSVEEQKQLSDSILLGLPGTVDDLTPEEFLKYLKTYDDIDDEKLRQNLYDFLNEIAPLCVELDVRMAIHPDDPPRPIFGLPRIMSKEQDVVQMFKEVPYENIGLTFCAGSFGGGIKNDVASMFEKFVSRIHFAHLRNVVYEGTSFHESSHLCGRVDMNRVMTALIKEEERRKNVGYQEWQIVMRPDHGRFMDIDKGRKCYSGYSYGGRLVGLAELRGLEQGIRYGAKPLMGKVAVVTGAAGVLCSVMAKSLLMAGAKVALLDLRLEAAESVCAKLREEGYGETLALEANVLERETLEKASSYIVSHWGKIDILVNGAGGNHPKGTCKAEQYSKDVPIEDTFFGLDISGFEFVNKLNFIGSLLPSQVFGKVMVDKGGSIINISSMAAFQPLTKIAAYAAAKSSIENFTKWLATHLAPANIRVNAIAPGFFLTEQNRFLMLEEDGKTLTPRGNKVLNKTPTHTFGKPEDLCGALKFLVSEEASFVTGIVIPIDGGFLAYSGV